ncbi:MAG: nucleoside triphosphate pyrophosphohydrolase [Verrucomicrobiales bacterium]
MKGEKGADQMQAGQALEALAEVVCRLRAPDGCPWDREQTHATLREALIEETYEVLEAIEHGTDADLREELGDLLLHVVLHSQMAAERHAFTLNEVAQEVTEKLIRRHPHVFGEISLENSDEVLTQWEAIKSQEKQERTSVMDGIPPGLPAASEAQKLQKRATRLGMDWSSNGAVLDQMQSELRELVEAGQSGDVDQVEAEVGDVLFTAVNLARRYGVSAELSLRAATKRFSSRIRHVELLAKEQGVQLPDASEETLNDLWQQAKARLKQG